MPCVNVVFPDPLSPATPITKIYGDAAIVSLKFGRYMRTPVVERDQVKTIAMGYNKWTLTDIL
jgi:hypothetical protein